jgi:hypothetical protein
MDEPWSWRSPRAGLGERGHETEQDAAMWGQIVGDTENETNGWQAGQRDQMDKTQQRQRSGGHRFGCREPSKPPVFS